MRILDRMPGAIRETLGGVDLPIFVASFCQGAFHAIVDASIQQMEAYRELLAVVKTVGEFTSDSMILLLQTLVQIIRHRKARGCCEAFN